MMSIRLLFSRIRRGLVGAGLLLLVALAVACGGGGGGGGNGSGDNGGGDNGGDNGGGNGGGGGSGGGNLDAFSNLPTSSVIVPAAAGDGNAVLTITVAGATLQPLARSGFMSDGGATATISLTSNATVIFDSDNKVAPLVLSAVNSDGAATATIRFVSAPRVITADLLPIPVAALDVTVGATILAAGAAEISIWHNGTMAVERYEISPDDDGFGVDSAMGLVTAMTVLTPTVTYDLTLHLIDSMLALTASRSLRVTVGVLPPPPMFVNLPASPVVAAAAADVGDAAVVITVANAILPSFERSGFGSGGGEMATISLVSDPVSIFTFDNAVVSLTITLSDSRRTIAATLRFMSAPRVITADLLPMPVAALEAVAGATILAAGAAGISIWHNGTAAIEEYEISPNDGNFGVDKATGLVTATTDLTPEATYDLTLHLVDSMLTLTASRSLLVTVGAVPPSFMDLPVLPIVVAADAGVGEGVLTVTTAHAALPSFPDRSGFMSDGGATATIALASVAMAVFDSDNAVALLALTLNNGGETATTTIRFVSALRVIDADLLRISVTALEAVAGATILAAGEAKISIWHNDAAAVEEYKISPDDGNFGVDSATGLVTATTDLTPGETYNLTLHLIDRGLALTASQSLRAVVGALPLLEFAANLPASSVVVATAADIGDSVLTITAAGAALLSFARSGFRSDGGETATIALASIPADIFTLDYAVASLSFTLSDRRQTVAATVRFVSAPRAIAADLLLAPVAAFEAVAGVTILAAGEAKISIWHNDAAVVEEYKISPDDGNFGVDSATGLVTATTDLTPDETYDLTLHLIDRGLALTASRSLRVTVGALLPLGFAANLPASSVVVAADADIGDAVLTITVAGAALPPFVRSGFRSDGGAMAAISLASIPADIFTLDYAVASLAFTLSDPRRTIAATVRFVSAPRVIAADLLSISVAALDAVAGATILAADAAEISIWHNDAGAVEEYEISPNDGDFGVDSATGLVTATTDLTPGKTYNLTLHLIDRGLSLTASRSLEAVVGALPLLDFVRLPASSVVVAADADIGDAVLTITVAGATLPSFARLGFMSDGGETATIALASIPAEVFTLDHAVASLAFTLSDRRQTVAATIRFVSAPRVIAADLLSISVAALEALAGVTILAAGAADISIWHNDAAAVEEYDISPDDGNFGVDSATGLVTATTDLTPGKTYNLTLHLVDRGLSLTASRSLEAVVGALPLLDFVRLPASSVVVAADADIGDAVLTITVAGATLPSFARSGFRSDGGATATISLASIPADIFTLDYAVASLSFTLSDRRQTVAATIRFVSAPRVITADLLSAPVAALEAVAGVTILAAGAAEISIWHNDAAAVEEYDISPNDGNFGVDSSTGLVTATTDLTPGKTYNLTLHLIDHGLALTASRSLEAVVGVLPLLDFVRLPASSVVIAAAADIGDAVLTITVAGATLPSFARSGFMSDGGALATISLASEATVVFNSDNAVASLAFTLSDRRRTVAATIRFVSAPRVIAAAPATISVSFTDAVAGVTILAAGAAKISIWHNGAEAIEEYDISPDDGNFGVDLATGLVTAAMDLTAGDSYDFTLRLTDDALSLTASRSLRVVAGNLGPLQLRYLSTVEWSRDNAYDYLVEQDGEIINLSVVGGVMTDGATRETAIPIYNIWQLQAIDGLQETSSGSFSDSTLFGANADERLGRHYRLMNDIDAGVTEEWVGGQGFHPIGDGQQTVGLQGGLYGDGYAIRDLWINRPSTSRVGLFAVVDGGVIASVGIEDARIAGFTYVGALVGEQIEGVIQNAWASGTVTSNDWWVGGLAGRNGGGAVVDSWTRSDVRGRWRVGGLVGAVDPLTISGITIFPVIERGQAMGDVRGVGNVGGLVGRSEDGMISENRSLATVTGENFNIGGLIGYSSGGDIVLNWSSGPVRGRLNVGGLVGRNVGGMISENRSLAAVTGEERIGGLIGASFSGDVVSNWSSGPVRGGINVGGLVGRHWSATIARNWSIAAVTGKENVGGLIGNIISDGAGAVVFNWSAGSARGDFGIGGLIGRNRNAEVENNWSVASASGEQFVGGLLGRVENSITDHVRDNWSGGAVAAQKNGGGMLGYVTNYRAIPAPYWSEETSGIDFSYRRSVRQLYPRSGFGGIPSMQEATVPLFESDPWHNGDSDLSDNAADFPVLTTLDIGLQWAGLAYGLTRVLASVDGAEMAEWGERREMSRRAVTIRIDTNAMAPDTRAEGGVTSTPDCALVGGVLRATTNYNSAIVLARAEGGVLSSVSGCEAVLTPNAGARRATLHLAFAAAGATLRRTHEMRYFDAGDLAARADFLANVEWSKTYAQGDDDGDGIPNAYDYRPRGDAFDLRFDEAGEFYDFWPIYNVWQLQAIDGETPGYAGGEDLFGVSEPIRLGGRYRLMNDIDAVVTEEWPDGFAPIGDYLSSFGGEFMGGGYVVKNLRINRANDFRAGLFAHLTGEVRDLGMTGRVVGDYEVGGLVGYMSRGLLANSWSLAAVSGALWVGGLAGRQGGGLIDRSWSSGRVRAEIDGGGLVGDQAGGAIADSWSSGLVESDYDAGGLAGDQTFGSGILRSWSAGSASATAIGGAAGGFLGSSFGVVVDGYWSGETSGRLRSAAGDGVATAQTLSLSAWNPAWSFGDGELSDGDGDFPVLSGLSEEWQATGLGLGLARVLAVNGAGEIALRSGETNIVDEAAFAALRLDANGLAADDGGDRTSSPSCRFAAGTLEAETNYNGATLRLRLLPTTAGELRAYDSGRCEAGFAVTGSGAATLRVESSSGSARAHFDYPLDLRLLLSSPLPVDEGGGAALSIYAPRRLLLPSRAEAGYVALTASVSAGAIEASSGGGFSTGGGAVAFVTLTEAATAAFATDGARLIFALAATASGNRAAAATAIFGSRPLALDGGITTVSLRALRAVSGRLLLSALSVSAGVKHYEGEKYRLANDYGGLFAADPESGEIRLSRRVDAAVDAVLELRAEGGGVAGTQSLRVQAPAALVSERHDCKLGQQWRCRDEFYAILTAAIAVGEATLNDNQAVVFDRDTHGDDVLSVFSMFGSGASITLYEGIPRNYFLSNATFDADNKKPIINYSYGGTYGMVSGLNLSVFNRRDAILVQSSGNSWNTDPDHSLFQGSHFDRERAEAVAETGRLVIVGGYRLTSENPANGEINVQFYYSKCGFTKEYCLIAEAVNVPPGNLFGTSFAAPQVAAALQMLATMWPELSQDSLVSLLLALASDITFNGGEDGVGVDEITGHGALSFRRLFSADGAMGFKCSIVENACVSDYF